MVNKNWYVLRCKYSTIFEYFDCVDNKKSKDFPNILQLIERYYDIYNNPKKYTLPDELNSSKNPGIPSDDSVVECDLLTEIDPDIWDGSQDSILPDELNSSNPDSPSDESDIEHNTNPFDPKGDIYDPMAEILAYLYLTVTSHVNLVPPDIRYELINLVIATDEEEANSRENYFEEIDTLYQRCDKLLVAKESDEGKAKFTIRVLAGQLVLLTPFASGYGVKNRYHITFDDERKRVLYHFMDYLGKGGIEKNHARVHDELYSIIEEIEKIKKNDANKEYFNGKESELGPMPDYQKSIEMFRYAAEIYFNMGEQTTVDSYITQKCS